MAYELPKLPYELDALEPVISKEIMDLHYNKHHKTYVTKLNEALEKYAKLEGNEDLAEMIALQNAIKFNGGGHVNHSIFWTNLAPQGNGGGGEPSGELATAIKEEFGSFESFVETFNNKAAPIQGSGWCWLSFNKSKDRLEIVTCSNQDPCSTTGNIPLLGVDVWEHAYYLQYKNVRPDYLKAIWGVVNWSNVEERFMKAKNAVGAGAK
jgi:Fe-Mn family superoxide dismutase